MMQMRLHWFFMTLVLGVASLGWSQESAPLQDGQVRVLIGSVINKSPEYVEEFLQSLQALQKKNCTCDYYFVLEQSAEIVQQHTHDLEEAGQPHKASCVLIDPSKERPLGYSHIWQLGAYKDWMVEYARKNNYDYLFLVDADLVLRPETLGHLMSVKKDIVSSIIWTDWGGGPVPQVWRTDNGNLFDCGLAQTISEEERNKQTTEFIAMLKVPGTYEVGGLGACTLISQTALKRPINFQRIRNLSWVSENVHFSLRATALGIPLFVDTHYPTYHIVRDTGECSVAGAAELRKSGGIAS
jgi:hypothetical protein